MRKSAFWVLSLLVLLCLGLALLTPFAAAAAGGESAATGAENADARVFDDAGLLTAGECAALTEHARTVRGKVDCYIVTGTYRSRADIPSAGVMAVRCGIRENASALVLLIRVVAERGGSVTYYYDIYTYGRAERRFSGRDIDRILDDPDVMGPIKAGRVAEGADRALTLASKNAARRLCRALVWGGVAAAAFGVGAALLARRACMRRRCAPPPPAAANLALTTSRDDFLGAFVTRTRIQTGSSGGSHGGGHSGGGHSGGHSGGGSHRGGR